jgi:hypothetical protein
VGATQVSDPAGRSQLEIDVVGVRAGDTETMALIGEAKASSKPVGVSVLARLERARELLSMRAALAGEVKLAMFSASGFDRALLAVASKRGDVELVDLERLYTGA